MDTALSWKAYVVLGVLLVTLLLSFWRKGAQRDTLFFVGAILTAIAGVVPGKALFQALVNASLLILFVQQLLSRLLLPKGKWRNPLLAALLAPFGDHERLLLAFRGRHFPLAFLIAIAGVTTPIGSPIALTIYALTDYTLSWVALASLGLPLIAIALIFLRCAKTCESPPPLGDAIIPLGSLWTLRGKEEGEVVELNPPDGVFPDLLPLRNRGEGFWEGFRWHPFLMLTSALLFATAVSESGLDQYGHAVVEPFLSAAPLVYELTLFLVIFALSHCLPNALVAALFLPFASTPLLPIVAASCAFLSPRSSDVHLLAKGLSNREIGDFLKFGTPLSLACLLMELLWN